MAERRMFAKTIIDSDAFLDMPLSTQALYFHLSMRADDDGFINNPKKVQRMIGAADDDLKVLITKKFIIPFESGIVVIKHWKIHNYIRNDRYKETVYKDEKQHLYEKENKSYTLTPTDKPCGIPSDIPSGIPSDNQTETQVRLGKDSIGKDRIDKKDKDIDFLEDEKSFPQIQLLINSGYIKEDDEQLKKYNDFIEILRLDYREDLIDKVVSYFITNKPDIVQDKFSYFQTSILNNLDKITGRKVKVAASESLNMFKQFLEA
jgi:hypothetical protein